MTTQPEALALADALDRMVNEGWATESETQAAALLRTQHAEIERKDALLRQALEALKNSRSLEPVGVDWVKGERHSIIAAIKQELQ